MVREDSHRGLVDYQKTPMGGTSRAGGVTKVLQPDRHGGPGQEPCRCGHVQFLVIPVAVFVLQAKMYLKENQITGCTARTCMALATGNTAISNAPMNGIAGYLRRGVGVPVPEGWMVLVHHPATLVHVISLHAVDICMTLHGYNMVLYIGYSTHKHLSYAWILLVG